MLCCWEEDLWLSGSCSICGRTVKNCSMNIGNTFSVSKFSLEWNSWLFEHIWSANCGGNVFCQKSWQLQEPSWLIESQNNSVSSSTAGLGCNNCPLSSPVSSWFSLCSVRAGVRPAQLRSLLLVWSSKEPSNSGSDKMDDSVVSGIFSSTSHQIELIFDQPRSSAPCLCGSPEHVYLSMSFWTELLQCWCSSARKFPRFPAQSLSSSLRSTTFLGAMCMSVCSNASEDSGKMTAFCLFARIHLWMSIFLYHSHWIRPWQLLVNWEWNFPILFRCFCSPQNLFTSATNDTLVAGVNRPFA